MAALRHEGGEARGGLVELDDVLAGLGGDDLQDLVRDEDDAVGGLGFGEASWIRSLPPSAVAPCTATDPGSEVRDAVPPARQQPCLMRQASARATLSRLRLRVRMRLGLRRLLHAAIAAPVPRRDAPLRARAPEFGVPLLLSRRSPQTLPSW